jgi:hypothetical protein
LDVKDGEVAQGNPVIVNDCSGEKASRGGFRKEVTLYAPTAFAWMWRAGRLKRAP